VSIAGGLLPGDSQQEERDAAGHQQICLSKLLSCQVHSFQPMELLATLLAPCALLDCVQTCREQSPTPRLDKQANDVRPRQGGRNKKQMEQQMEQQKQGAEEPKQQSTAEHQESQLRCWMEGRGWAEAEAESIHRAGRARSKEQEAKSKKWRHSRSSKINQGAKAPKDQEKIHSRVSGKIKWGVGRKGRRFVKAEAKSIHAAGRAGARSKKQEKEAQQEQQNQSRKQQAEARDQSKGEIEGSAGTTDDAGAAGARSGRR
jgi:hypothetical protein